MFENLKKSVVYIVTVNMPEVLPILFHIIAAVPLPLSVIAMLSISIGTDLVRSSFPFSVTVATQLLPSPWLL